MREELLSIGSPQRYSPGQEILLEGAREDYLVLLKSGRVKVTGRLGSGQEVLIAIRVGGDVVGEMAVIDDVPRSATVTASDDVEAYVIQGWAMRRFLEERPEVTLEIARLSTRRLRKANSWRIAFADSSVRVRLAWMLAELAQEHGIAVRSYVLICLDLTQTELGAFIGAKQSAVHKTLASFRDEGIITTGSRRMEVMKLDRLREIGGLPTIGR
ncbi:Crp/Fnr family transcriptional regulator [Kitasatospora sp. NPDC096077]|uniref:Crp/Fnr family transcriptional regulator n=1 Tax=Kitasatospora sp. NPDC096077 TaxID=3155544 RepID=UPI003318E3A3